MAHAGFREHIHPDLPSLPAESGVSGVREASFQERTQRSRDMTSKKPRAVRDSGLGHLSTRLGDFPESVEVDEDALGRGELHVVPMRRRLLKRASHDSHAISAW